jgi:hypothetical protein
MSDDNTQDDYKVGYRKPPRNTRFQKGVSGNPTGRPKKSLDFDRELIREANSLMTISENGKRRRISKLQGIKKQLHNKALTGNIQAMRIYFDLLQPALERTAQLEAHQANEKERLKDPKRMTDEEMMRKLIEAELEEKAQANEKETRKEEPS